MKRKIIYAFAFLFAVTIAICVYFHSLYKYRAEYCGGLEESKAYLEQVNEHIDNFICNEDSAADYGEMLIKNSFPQYCKTLKNVIWYACAVEPIFPEWGEEKVWKVSYSDKNSHIDGGNIGVYFKHNGEVLFFDFAI